MKSNDKREENKTSVDGFPKRFFNAPKCNTLYIDTDIICVKLYTQ